MRLRSMLVCFVVASGCSAADVSPAARDGAAPIRVLPSKSAKARAQALPADPVALGCNAAHLATQGGGSIQAPTITVTELDWGSVASSTHAAAQQLYQTLDETLVRTVDDPPYVPWSTSLRAEYGTSPIKAGSPLQITPANASTSLTDYDIQKELARQVTLGAITADNAHFYMVHLPATVTVRDSSGTGCVDWCAYHQFTTVGSGQRLFYAVIPDLINNVQCASQCSEAEGFTLASGLQSAASHELAEMMTDGDLTGWQDPSEPATCGGDEIGDICANELANIISWNSWDTPVTVQKLWSNRFNDCIVGDTIPTISSISPSSGPRAGGTTVTITGARFIPGQTTFKFGPAAATQVSCASSTTCTVVTPTANASLGTSVPVPVQASSGGVASSWDGAQDNFTYTCAPKACQAGQCGSFDDGCGGTSVCTCGAGQVCTWNQTCCAPLPAAQACGSQTCGTASDGCGGTVTCGPACACVPLTCAQAAASCGQVSDGCGGTLSCGSCAYGFVCSGGACIRSCTTAACRCAQAGGVWDGKYCE
jgi:hypothetical protein